MVSTDRRRGITASAAIKVACIAGSTSNLTLEGEQTVDGISLVTGDRVLVKNQTSAPENGIYEVDTSSWKREPDWDGSFDVREGTLVPISRGTVNTNTLYRVSNIGDVVVGTTSVTFEAAVVSVSSGVSFLQAGTGAVATTSQAKHRERVSVKDFDAKGDGVTDDTAAIQAADDSSFESIYAPEGDYLTTLANFNSLSKRYFGEGQINTTAGKVSPYFAHRDGLPSSFGTHSSMLTAFDGDLSGSVFQASQSVRNGSLGTPTTGFLFTLETALSYHFSTVASTDGHNQETGGNDGRTAYVQNKGQIIHQGNGDSLVFHAGCTVSGSKAGATHFLAQPAAALYGGLAIAGASKTNVTLGELALDDNGFDCRGTGFVINFDRSVTTGANSMFWSGMRLQSRDEECEAAYQLTGKWNVGLDMTPATIGGVAIALKQSQKIEFHATVAADSAGVNRYADNFNLWDMQYTGTAILFRAASTSVFQYNATQIISQVAHKFDGNIGFYTTIPIAQQTGVAVTAGGIHAALVNLGLITA